MIYNSTATSGPVLYFIFFFLFLFFGQEQFYASSLASPAKRYYSVRRRRISRLELFHRINDSRSTGTGIAVARDKARKRLREA